MIFASALLGALLRRGLHRLGTNALIQPFCASLFAGVVAALAFRYQLITSLPPAGGNNFHGTTAAGGAAPRLTDGSYRFQAAWRYLFGL